MHTPSLTQAQPEREPNPNPTPDPTADPKPKPKPEPNQARLGGVIYAASASRNPEAKATSNAKVRG